MKQIHDVDYEAKAADGGVTFVGDLTASRTVTLPPLASMASQPAPLFPICSEASNTNQPFLIKIVPAGNDQINGSAKATPSLSGPFTTALLVAGGTSWIV